MRVIEVLGESADKLSHQQRRATVSGLEFPAICKSHPAEALTIFEDLPVAGKDNGLDGLIGADESVLHGEDELCVVDTGEVAGAGGLHLLGLGGEGEGVDEVVWDEGVPLVGHDETEVAALAATEAVVTVEDELDLVDGVAVVLAGVVEVVVLLPLAAAAGGPDELDDGVVEVDGQMDLAAGGDGQREALDGVHELLEAGGGEAVTLGTVQVDVETLEVDGHVGVLDGGAGVAVQHTGGKRELLGEGIELDAATQLGELHDDLHSVELERNQGKGVAGVVGEPEGKGNVEGPGLLGVGHQLGHGEALSNHLLEALSGLARKLLPHEQVVVVHRVDDLATDNHRDPLRDVLANRIDPVAVGQLEPGANLRVGRWRNRVARRAGGAAAANLVAPVRLQPVATGVARIHRLEVLAAHRGQARHNPGNRDLQVREVQQVTGPIQTHLHLRAKPGAYNRLANWLKNKMCMFCIPEPPECNGRVL